MFIRAKIWANLFENLAAGWLGTIFFSVQSAQTVEILIFFLFRNILGGIMCLLIAESILRKEEYI